MKASMLNNVIERNEKQYGLLAQALCTCGHPASHHHITPADVIKRWGKCATPRCSCKQFQLAPAVEEESNRPFEASASDHLEGSSNGSGVTPIPDYEKDENEDEQGFFSAQSTEDGTDRHSTHPISASNVYPSSGFMEDSDLAPKEDERLLIKRQEQEFTVTTIRGPMKIAAKSQEAAEELACRDGHELESGQHKGPQRPFVQPPRNMENAIGTPDSVSATIAEQVAASVRSRLQSQEAQIPTPQPASQMSSFLPATITHGAKVAGYTPTEEQKAILDIAPTLRHGQQFVITAGAGTGKTSTLKMLEEILPGRGQYTAFNASLVAEAKTKFKKCRVNTTHSLAFGAVGRLYASRLNGPRVRSDQVARTLGIQPFPVDVTIDGETKSRSLTPAFLAGQVLVAVRKFCQSADHEINQKHFHYIDGIDFPSGGKRSYENNDAVKDYLVSFACKAWDDLSSTSGQLPFTHDCYFKTWQLSDSPRIYADYILLDEAQDTAPVLLDVLRRQQALLVFVGDSNQQIYEWRGAVNAMKAFPNAPRRLLSQSFRFGQIIADVANSILVGLEEPTDLIMKGDPSIPSRVDKVDEPRAILCRTNARAVASMLQRIQLGKRPHLIGGGAEVVAFVKGALQLQNIQPTSHPELCCFQSWREVEEYSKSDEGEDLRLMCRLIKEFGCDAIIGALEHMPQEKDADLVICTAHKSKGREWQSVKLAKDFPPSTEMTDSDRRLLYVAATRAQHVLDISACPPFCGGQDEESGQEYDGITVNYTVSMPTKEECDAYRKDKVQAQSIHSTLPIPSMVPSAGPISEPAPNPVPRSAGQVGPGEFKDFKCTWLKHNEVWVIRGPVGAQPGAEVTVHRKNGTSSTERLGEVVREFPEAWLYRSGK